MKPYKFVEEYAAEGSEAHNTRFVWENFHLKIFKIINMGLSNTG